MDKNKIYEEVKNKGFYIFKNMITIDEYNKVRKESIRFFEEESQNSLSSKKPLRGNVEAGMMDIIGQQSNKNWKIIRGCFFPWNRVNEKLKNTINLSRRLSVLRNEIIGKEKDLGLQIENNGFIQYTSLSLYPNNGGFLHKHYDGHSDDDPIELIHFKVELTHKFIDYDKGGFYVWDNDNNVIDVSSLVKPTDVIFFKGTNFHEIRPIKGSMGRIALFEIPTYVTKDSRKADYTSDEDSKIILAKQKLKKICKSIISSI